MPDWNVTSPDGLTVTISGDDQPTESDLDDIFSHPDLKSLAKSVQPPAQAAIPDSMFQQFQKTASQSTAGQLLASFPSTSPVGFIGKLAVGETPFKVDRQDLTPEQQENMDTASAARNKMIGQGSSPLDVAKNADAVSKKWDAIIQMARESRPENVARFEAMRDKELREAGSEPIGEGRFELPKVSAKDVTDLTGVSGRTARNVANVQNQVAGAAESLATPEGLAMGLPGAGESFARAFIPQMIQSATSSLGKSVGHYSAGDTELGDRELASAAATSAMLVVPHVLGKGEPSTKGTADVSTPSLPEIKGDIPIQDRINAIDGLLSQIEKQHGPRDSFDPKTQRAVPRRINTTREDELLKLRDQLTEQQSKGAPDAIQQESEQVLPGVRARVQPEQREVPAEESSKETGPRGSEEIPKETTGPKQPVSVKSATQQRLTQSQLDSAQEYLGSLKSIKDVREFRDKWEESPDDSRQQHMIELANQRIKDIQEERGGPSMSLQFVPAGKESAAEAPEVPEGKIRLYQGSGGAEGGGAGGSWFTTDAQRAASYGPNIKYVDVSEDDFNAGRQMAQQTGMPTKTDTLLPNELVKQAKEHPPIAQDVYDLDQPVPVPQKPNLAQSVQGKLKSLPVDQLLKFTPDQFTKWKKMSKYGPDDAGAIADRISDDDLEKLKSERDRLREETEKELPDAKTDEAMKSAMSKSLKAQTLNEIIQAKEAKAPEHITAATYTHPETAKVTEGRTHEEAAAKQGVEVPKERSARETKEYGFKTNKQGILSRAQAYKVAKKSGQLINEPESPSELHSEHLRMPGDKETVKEPEMIGMGGAARGEIPESQGGEDIYGVSQKALEARAAAGKTAPIEPGEGISGIKAMQRGRDLLDAGYDAVKGVEDFEKTGAVHPDTVMAARAHGERLAQAADRIEQQKGTDSPEWQAAFKAVADWDTRIKPMATKLSRGFSALQGATDIDTGTFLGLQRMYYETTGKVFTPEQAAQAKSKVADVQVKDQQLDTSLQDFSKGMQQELGIKETKPVDPAVLEKQLADGVEPEQQEKVQSQKSEQANKAIKAAAEGKPENEQAEAMWHVLNEFYLKKGIRDFDKIIDGLAEDFGMQRQQVVEMLRGNKKLRELSNDVWRKQQDARTVRQAAERWLQDQQTPGWQRALAQIPRTTFVLNTAGHGTVGPVTHAGVHIFDPMSWTSYFPNAVRGFGMAWNKAYHERMVQDLARDKNFSIARQGGLANDPFRYADDYQSAAIRSWLGKLGGLVGNRGFDSLKLIRQSLFNKTWDALPPEQRTLRQAELLSNSINHSTGIVKTKFPEAANVFLFAPKLEASRWAWMIGDTVNSGKTFTNWKNASPEERMAAMRDVRQKARMAGTYFALLAINQGFLNATGSDQKINGIPESMGGAGIHPLEGNDFLSFKVAGHKIGIIGPMIGIVRFLGKLYHDSVETRSKSEKRFSRFEESARDTGQYVRGKLSPFAGINVDLAARADIFKRPLPSSDEKVPKYLRSQGVEPYTWPEYATDKLAPIPFKDFVADVWQRQGMSPKDIESYFQALTIAGAMGTTGVRVTPDKQ